MADTETERLNREREEVVRERQRVELEKLTALQNRNINLLMSTGDGRDFLWYLLGLCKVGSTPFRDNDRKTAFACGEQNIGQQIQSMMMQFAPEHYITLLKERQK